jgi:Mg-chelatase subunit ChlD
MSFLTPLYILGALAVVGPIIFHLIRRMPKGEVPFSSLMFLTPTPPRLTRRSRLDNVLLLLLRALVLCLLAAAFARPFWRQAMQLDFGASERRRTVVLVDQSASMRRADLWPRAREIASKVIADSRRGDELAVLAFDTTSHPVLGFEESGGLDATRRQAVAESRLKALTPSWAATDLGRALVDAVAAIEDVADKGEKAGKMPRRVVLISDLQQGARLDALGEFAWPSDVELDLKAVATDGSNAGLSVLTDPTEAEPAAGKADEHRVRVSNDATSNRESFEVVWINDQGRESGQPIEAYVPPGESRVVRVSRPAKDQHFRSLQLKGDVHGFDNALYFADVVRDEAKVVYVGTDAEDDPSGLFYFLQRVFSDSPGRTVRVLRAEPSATLAIEPLTALVIVTSEVNARNARDLRTYLQNGGTLLFVVGSAGPLSSLGTIANVSPFEAEDAEVKRDVLLGAISFAHPLFAPFAGAGFNDFTKIRFWKYRKIDPNALGDATTVARFENGDPAILEKLVGKGRLVVMTTSWTRDDSQLARSSKFVPLMISLLELRDPLRFVASNVKVLDRVPIPPVENAETTRRVHKPSGATGPIDESNVFSETDEPGVYTIDVAKEAKPMAFAVNLDPSESKIAPLAAETLEQFGCKLANPSRKSVDAEQLRQMHNGELESRQKLWRWLILAAIAVLIVETWLAGRLSRPSPAPSEALST